MITGSAVTTSRKVDGIFGGTTLAAPSTGVQSRPVPGGSLLAGYRDDGVDRAPVAAVDTRLTDPEPPWWLREAMVHVFARFGDRDPIQRAAPFGESFDEVAPEVLTRVWEEARRSLKMPDVPLAPRPSPRLPVGPDTPS